MDPASFGVLSVNLKSNEVKVAGEETKNSCANGEPGWAVDTE
jgi:hypothetical protein